MAFCDQVLPSNCQLYSDSLPEPDKTKALEVDVLKQERDKSFKNFVDASHSFWKKLEDEGTVKQGDGKKVDINSVNETFLKLKETSKQFGRKLKRDVLKSKSQQSPTCPLYKTFFNLESFKYKKKHKVEVDGDKREWEKRLCKYLDDKYPNGNTYVYHFPLRYDFETEKNDRHRISAKLDCSECLSHYSDNIMRELLKRSQEKFKGHNRATSGENAEEKKQYFDPLVKKGSVNYGRKNESEDHAHTKRFECREYERQGDHRLKKDQSVMHPGPEHSSEYSEYGKQAVSLSGKKRCFDACPADVSNDPAQGKLDEHLEMGEQDVQKVKEHKKQNIGAKKKDPDLKTLVQQYLQRRNSLKAVQNVCQCIELWSSRKNPIHVFIMANISYKSYLKQYNQKRTVTENEGDHDILLIIKEIGIVFIQVKSCKIISVDLEQIKKGFQQILRDQVVFLESNRDLSFIHPNFPMWGFIALPNASRCTLPYDNLCGPHKKIVLCKEDLQDMEWFNEILIKSQGTSPWTDQQFRYLCARYVGEGKSKGMQELSKEIEAVIRQFGRKIFTPKQKVILSNNHPCQVIKGEFGSGKSLLLCKKVYDLSVMNGNDKQKAGFPTQCTNVLFEMKNAPSEKTDQPFQMSDTPTTLAKDPTKQTDYPTQLCRNFSRMRIHETQNEVDPPNVCNDVSQNTQVSFPMVHDSTEMRAVATCVADDPQSRVGPSHVYNEDNQTTHSTTRMIGDRTEMRAGGTHAGDDRNLSEETPFQKINDTSKNVNFPIKTPDDSSQITHSAWHDLDDGDKIYLITCVGLGKDLQLNTTVLDFPAVQQLQKYVEDIEEQEEVKTFIKIEYMTLAYLLRKYNLLEAPHQNYIKLTSDKFNTLFSKVMLESNKIFIDEMPLSLFNDLETYMLFKREDFRGYEGFNIWVSIATQSCYGVIDPKNETPGKLFESAFLDENMRNSCSIVKLMRSICIYTGETLISNPDIGHCIEGPTPLLCRIPCCRCSIDVIKDTIFCECFEKRVKDTLKFVHNVLGCTNENNADVVYMISHFYNNTFRSSIFAKLKKLFDRVLEGLDRKYHWFTLANTDLTECKMGATNFDARAIDVTQETLESESKTKIVKSGPQTPKLDTKEFEKKMIELDKSTTNIQKEKAQFVTKTKDSDTERIGSGIKSMEGDLQTAVTDTEIHTSIKWSKENELIIDETTFAGCEKPIVIYIDLLSMWQLLPAERSEGNSHQLSSRKTRVGAGSILVPSRCTSQYVHIVLQAEEPQIFINEHIKMFKDASSKNTDLKTMCNKATHLMEECLKNHGELLDRLLDEGVIKEVFFPVKLT